MTTMMIMTDYMVRDPCSEVKGGTPLWTSPGGAQFDTVERRSKQRVNVATPMVGHVRVIVDVIRTINRIIVWRGLDSKRKTNKQKEVTLDQVTTTNVLQKGTQ